ncbi:sulfite exporter TauE/SafE family protein [Vallicoccus soli]|uniref:Probable membrane transporter protein n=1 Tax=Vallicoccus soli TaxID=2339232 RepID=A0A3A3ZKG7_9ACTN|nr:sulfite exporter TauE/SafE family protein [Vallicoccus soli]RJK96340.1 sulfite exporter TauE/SafE family protein [Vallicoccus soli]
MERLLVFVLVGLGAQLVDGALGMAYGVTSTSLLLISGLNPAAASASVHLAELGTTLASGISHWRFKNVDWRLVLSLGVPGALGAFAGATLLSRISTELAAPWMALVLAVLGGYVLVKFALRSVRAVHEPKPPHSRRFLAPLGLTAGFVDATGGGGWGPVATSTLLSAGRVQPRTVIGSVSTSEFLVTLAASVGFLIGLGGEGVNLVSVAGLLIGGVVAAPFAAYLVRALPVNVLGAGVGGLLMITNARTLMAALEVTGALRVLVYLAVVAVWALFLQLAVRKHLASREERAQELVAA